MAPPANDDAGSGSDGRSGLDALTPGRAPVERVALERVEGMASSQGRAAASYATSQPVAPPRPLRGADSLAAEPAVIVEDLHTQPMLMAPLGAAPSSGPQLPPAPSSSGAMAQLAAPPAAPRGRRSHTVIVDRAAFARRRGARDKVLAFVVMAAVVGAVGVLALVLRGPGERPVSIAGAARDPKGAASFGAPGAVAPVSPATSARLPLDPSSAVPGAVASTGTAPAPSAAVPRAFGAAPPTAPSTTALPAASSRRPAKASVRPPTAEPHDVDELKSTIQK